MYQVCAWVDQLVLFPLKTASQIWDLAFTFPSVRDKEWSKGLITEMIGNQIFSPTSLKALKEQHHLYLHDFIRELSEVH